MPAWATAFTSMFMHGGWMHLIGNMLYLWIFGNNVEDAMGHVRFTLFYLVCGLLALVAHAAPNAASQIPLIGASGAVSGVLGAYLLLYPHARVLVVIPFGFLLHTMRVRAVWVLGGWFVLQLVNSAMVGAEGAGVAWDAPHRRISRRGGPDSRSSNTGTSSCSPPPAPGSARANSPKMTEVACTIAIERPLP